MNDCISREELINTLQLMLSLENMSYGKKIYGKVIQQVKSLPIIKVKPKHAYVIVDEDGNMKCSNCGSSNCFDNYCGNCGAKLKGWNRRWEL